MTHIPTQKIERLRKRAARMEREGRAKCAEWDRNRKDLAYLSQPASRHSTFGRQRDRAMKRHMAGVDLLEEARKLREKADRLETYGMPEKGDAERRRQRRRDALDKVISVGSRVSHPMGGHGTVIRVNRKSYRVEFDGGHTWTESKHFFTPLRDEPDAADQVSA